jgi:hypothetical protein
MDLLDLIRESEHAADERAEWTHVLMPNMAYACDGGPLGMTDGGPAGRFTVGIPARLDDITCPDCASVPKLELRRRMHAQQYGPEHTCPTCPPTA